MTALPYEWGPQNGFTSFLAEAAKTAVHNPSSDRAEWDCRMAEYLRCDGLVHADLAFGPFRRAMDDHKETGWKLEGEYGKNYKESAQAAAILEASNAKMQQAEKDQLLLLNPLWDAQLKLVQTPAPDLAAVLFKIELIDDADVDNDIKLKRDAFEIIREDLANLAEESNEDTAWSIFLEAFREAEARLQKHCAIRDSSECGSPENLAYEETTAQLADAHTTAANRLLLTDAPDLKALRTKLDILASGEFAGSIWPKGADFARQVAKDGQRLIGATLTGEA